MAARIYTSSKPSDHLLQEMILVSQALGNGFENFAADPAVLGAKSDNEGFRCRFDPKGLRADKTLELNKAGQAKTALKLSQNTAITAQLKTASQTAAPQKAPAKPGFNG